MVLLTELESTAYGLMGTTVDDVVIRLSAPTLNTIEVRRPIDLLDLDKPEVLLRGIRFFCPEPDDGEYWPDWKELSHPLTYSEASSYFRDATTDPFHFYQIEKLFNEDTQQIESEEELERKFKEELERTRRSVEEFTNEEFEKIASKFYRRFTTRTVASVAIYREWGLRDPRQGEYFKWHKEKERIRQTIERGVETVFDYVVGCIFGGTLEPEYDTTSPVRDYIARLKQEILEPESDQQKWQALVNVSTRLGPRNKKQEFWPHFKYIYKIVSERRL